MVNDDAIKQERKKEFQFLLLYLLAALAIGYGAFAGNIVSLVLGCLVLAWVVLLRLKSGAEILEDNEDETEVKENHESTND